ncbi:MAG: pyridoxamine 5'-phosphate oxidase family protein [Candidatus Kuenenia sp.]|nr:pyridoxamine 5'-phosphate oxidase family protein [Candidatus Kuenenia hertensis]
MAEFFTELNRELQEFISRQKMFFIATASEKGTIAISPKCLDTFRCLDNTTILYLDLTGSGNETAKNLKENGRMTIMFCSFDKDPMILRLYGKGEVIQQDNEKWERFYQYFPDIPGKRQIILLHIESVQTSCGTSVPIYEFKRERTKLNAWGKFDVVKVGKQIVNKLFKTSI